jgi:hypothetical protein
MIEDIEPPDNVVKLIYSKFCDVSRYLGAMGLHCVKFYGTIKFNPFHPWYGQAAESGYTLIRFQETAWIVTLSWCFSPYIAWRPIPSRPRTNLSSSGPRGL